MVHIVTPYDDEIILLNKRLNKTYIYYGNKGFSKYSNQKMQDGNAISVNEAVAVKRTISKSGRLYDNSSWDLVDADKKQKVDYKKIEKKKLPKELQNKTEAEIKAYVKVKAKERAEIQKKIKELDKKRRSYIVKKQKEGSKRDQLDNVMVKAIKRQAKLKKYTW